MRVTEISLRDGWNPFFEDDKSEVFICPCCRIAEREKKLADGVPLLITYYNKTNMHHDHGEDILLRAKSVPGWNVFYEFLEGRYRRFKEIRICEKCNGNEANLKKIAVKGGRENYFDFFSFNIDEIRQITKYGNERAREILEGLIPDINRMVASIMLIAQDFKRRSFVRDEFIWEKLEKISKLDCTRAANLISISKPFNAPTSRTKIDKVRYPGRFDMAILHCLYRGAKHPHYFCHSCRRSGADTAYINMRNNRKDIVNRFHVCGITSLSLCNICYEFWKQKSIECRGENSFHNFLVASSVEISSGSPIISVQDGSWVIDESRTKELLDRASVFLSKPFMESVSKSRIRLINAKRGADEVLDC